ncbi:MAG TPA: type II toxin-antitoxin system RelE/ParE family toxin [Sulfurimonas sp.]|uniref:type II toxin-antitoxin system RelE/ParE family toxin n=1 Tax=Sulfurimonas sp. TaxID=2022749 RepID=UPI002BBE7316|nr:type II toxin-antitoxin system RelE/ParE family toxin [Sulfurimonas sp.]HUH43244.1 type II toxin-antitoxin system RelE/ParE family toxin [Sulfurimonas sp.]
MYKINFSKVALKNLVEQAIYIYEQTKSEELADRYLDKMKSYIVGTLQNFPKSGRATEELAADSRKLVYQGYSIIYKIMGNEINILIIFRENLPKF